VRITNRRASRVIDAFQALLLIERRTGRRPRQNTLGEAQNAFHIEFLELVGMSINLSERQLFAQPIALAFIRRFIDRMIKPPILCVQIGDDGNPEVTLKYAIVARQRVEEGA
jgi:hypothetical protein